jgi:signal transduction histidine kinase
VAGSLGELAGQRQVRIEVQCPLERLQVRGDVEQLRQALSCLVRNAVEAAPPEGWVRLSIQPCPARRRAEVAIEDSGPGPDPSQRPHLFDPFFSGRSAGRGRGLGLPIAWRLTRLQGGEVWLDACQPTPTRFVLSLPWAPENDVAAHPPPREACA